MEDGNSLKKIYNKPMRESKEGEVLYISSPEETILENITSAVLLQKEKIKEIFGNEEEKLINLAGFYRKKKEKEIIWAEARGSEKGVVMPANQKFKVQNLCLENEAAREIPEGKLTGIYVRRNDGIEDFSRLAGNRLKREWHIFGDKIKLGTEIYLIFDRLPEADGQITVYVRCGNGNTEEFYNEEKYIRWDILNKSGSVQIRCMDNTGCFMKSGDISFEIGEVIKEKIKTEFMKDEGYVIRGTLLYNEEILIPSVSSVSNLVFPLIPKETKAAVYIFEKKQECYVYSDIMEEEYVRVYVRNQGDSLYSLCDKSQYQMIRQDYGRYCCRLRHEYESIAICAYSGETAGICNMGYVYGYDGEEMDTMLGPVAGDSFSLIAEVREKGGAIGYDFIRPEVLGNTGFLYELDEKNGKIKILDMGSCVPVGIYVGEAAARVKENGILLGGTELIPVGYDTEIRFFSVEDTLYGNREESFEALKRRFVEDVYKSYTAVTNKDYERIVKGIPYIMVNAVRAWADEKENTINICVLTEDMKKTGKLNDYVRAAIMKEVERHRMLSVKVNIEEPVFVKVNVSAVISVEKHYEKCEENIKDIIERSVDFKRSGKNFGEVLAKEEIYREIEESEYVDYIEELYIVPEKYVSAKLEGENIKPDNNCLLEAGEIHIVLNCCSA